MKTKLVVLGIFLITFAQTNFAVTLPAQIRTYLNRNYKGWKLSPTTKDCAAPFTNNGVVTGNFNGDRKPDYAVKLTRGRKGYIIAFLAQNNGYKPFVLHDTDAGDVNNSSLGILKKGEEFAYGEDYEKSFRLRYDAPQDYRCESDVGGIHYFRNGKFVGY